MTDQWSPQPGGVPPAYPSDLEPAAPTGAGPKKPRTWIWIVVAVVVLALVAGLAYAASRQSGGKGLVLALRGGVTVPQVVGQTQQQAETALAEAGLKVGQVSESPTLDVAPGVVTAQSPEAGVEVKAESSVDMSVSVVPQVNVPDVVGKTQSDATAALAERNLVVGTTSFVYDTEVEAGYVKSQEPAADTEVEAGTAVALTLSKGTQTGEVPNVVGLAEKDAVATLEGAGFKVATTKASNLGVPAGEVMSQAPAPGTEVPTGSNVTITVSTGAPAPSTPATPSTPASPSTPPPSTTPTTPNPPAVEKVAVPDVVGMGLFEAIRALWKADLEFEIDFAESGDGFLKIVAQDPDAGTEVDPGSTVTISIGLPGLLFGDGGGLPSTPATETPSPTPTATPEPLPAEPPASAPSTTTTP